MYLRKCVRFIFLLFNFSVFYILRTVGFLLMFCVFNTALRPIHVSAFVGCFFLILSGILKISHVYWICQRIVSGSSYNSFAADPGSYVNMRSRSYRVDPFFWPPALCETWSSGCNLIYPLLPSFSAVLSINRSLVTVWA